jgi:hypothetical protein
MQHVDEMTFCDCSSLQSIDLPPSVDIDRETVLLSAKSHSIYEFEEFRPRSRWKKAQPITFSVLIRVGGDVSPDEFCGGYDQLLSDQSK